MGKADLVDGQGGGQAQQPLLLASATAPWMGPASELVPSGGVFL